jgi:lysophospholipase L1-like esterase
MDAHPTRLWGMSEAQGIPNAEDSQANINAMGFRGPLPDQPKPEGRRRILSTGDSSFYGFGVNDDEVFTHQLGADLVVQGLDVDVINAGVGGYTIAQHMLVMAEQGWALEPDLLILANVWSDNTWDTFRDEDLLLSNRFAQANPLTRSALVRLFAAWWSSGGEAESGRVIVWNAADGWPEGKVRRVPLDRWMALHDQLLREAARRGTGVIFLKPTNSFLLGESPMGPPPAWSPYFEAMDALAAHHQIPIIDVTTVYKAAMATGITAEELLWDKMHPTALGHRVLSQAIQARLASAGWPSEGLLPSTEAYAGASIDDIPSPDWFDDAGAGSPQLKLFDMTTADRAKIETDRQASAAEGPVMPHETGPVAPKEHLVSKGPRGVWGLGIEVRGGQTPLEVEVLDIGGNVVGRARLTRPNRFSLKIPQSVSKVTVQVTDAAGQVLRVPAEASAPSALVDLGG